MARNTRAVAATDQSSPTERLPAEVRALLREIRTTDGLFAVTVDQRIVHWSPEAEQLLGRAPQETLGRACHDVVAGQDSFYFRFCRRDCPVVRNARRGRATESYDLLVRDGEGVDRWINVTILVLPGARRSEPVVVHLIRDVTGQRDLEERAHRLVSTLKEALTGSVESEPSPAERHAVPLPHLTKREREVLRLIACGLTTSQIAESLGVSRVTARNHITNVQHKVGAKNRLQLVLYASQHALI